MNLTEKVNWRKAGSLFVLPRNQNATVLSCSDTAHFASRQATKGPTTLVVP